jgi:hypothetical protein
MVFSSRSPEGGGNERSNAGQRFVSVIGIGTLASVGIYLGIQRFQIRSAEITALPHPQDISVQSVRNVGPANDPGVTDLTGSFTSKPVNIRDALTTIELDIMNGHLHDYHPPTGVESVRCTDDAGRLYSTKVTSGSFACEIIFSQGSKEPTN